MKIARHKVKEGTVVGWLLLTPPTFKMLNEPVPVGIVPDRCGPIVRCSIEVDGNTGFGVSSCASVDEFSLGKGLKISLERAIEHIDKAGFIKVDTKPIWDSVLADGVLGRAITREDESLLARQLLDRMAGIAKTIQAIVRN